MASVDPVYAQWLQSGGLWQVSIDDALTQRWSGEVETSERMTTIATKADADAEGQRQLAFLGGPHATEEHVLPGEWASFLGLVVHLAADRLGYENGLDVFVIGAEDNRVSGTSTVTVVRRL